MGVDITLRLPEVIVKRIKELGVDVESKLIDLILQGLSLDPEEEAEAHLELAEKFLEDGRRLVDEDPTQASEKLYKAVEECIKALATHLGLKDIIEKVGERGRWTVTELEKAVEAESDRIGRWIEDVWAHAWVLHVLGFHEAKLDSEAVKRRLSYVEKIVEETRKIIGR